jgi:hypothetical protein
MKKYIGWAVLALVIVYFLKNRNAANAAAIIQQGAVVQPDGSITTTTGKVILTSAQVLNPPANIPIPSDTLAAAQSQAALSINQQLGPASAPAPAGYTYSRYNGAWVLIDSSTGQLAGSYSDLGVYTP